MNVSLLQDAYLRRLETFTQPEERNFLVANALRFIIQNVFAKHSNSFVFAIAAAGGPWELCLYDIMHKLFSTWGFMAVQLLIHDPKTERIEVLGNYYSNMIMIDSFQSLENINLVENKQNYDNIEYYFIFLQTHDELAVHEMELIFRYCFNNYWLHCNVMVQTEKGEILVYTYFPFKENNCFQTQPEMINQFQGDHFVSEEIFPDKLINLQGCPMKVTTWNTPPFVVNRTNKRYPKLKVTGVEVLIVAAISETMNFTLDIEWISFYKNQSPDAGLLEKLRHRETNITMGFFRRTNIRDKIATPTIVTFYVPLIALILRKLASHESMDILTFPFDAETWSLIIVAYVIMGIINSVRTRKIKGSIFQTYEIIMGVTTKDIPKRSSTRIRFMTTILSSFILRSVYQSLLFFVFRSNFYLATPQSIEGLATEGYKVVSTELTMQFLLYVPQIENKTLPVIVTNSSSEMSPMRYMEYRRNESLVAISIIEFALRYVREEMTFGTALRVLPMKVKDQQIGFYLAKHSYLIDRFDDYIMRLHQSGLTNKWREWGNLDFQVSRKRVNPTAYDSALMINLNQFAGFLKLMLFLHISSIALFALELLSQKVKWFKRFF
ncbi:uncharacterized protein LOC111674905 [Lucilia cuprina]|uniref:uncharacterized protein LOC111674905 n=1 Tax=Lucilia cuprina TaxID=7375 RepID=UPI001F065118|nr:uncharacterized protein LOC111674905 [Lucilia cuprina]